jgi:ElaA protein
MNRSTVKEELRMIKWQWSSFENLSTLDLYEILKVRQEVFVVEQNCVYQDADGLDKTAWHLVGWKAGSDGRKLVAYLRVVWPGKKFKELSIGRVLTAPSARGTGLGKALTSEALKQISTEYPGAAIRISAQKYLERFYSDFAFKTVSEPYDEDGIPHIEMFREGA